MFTSALRRGQRGAVTGAASSSSATPRTTSRPAPACAEGLDAGNPDCASTAAATMPTRAASPGWVRVEFAGFELTKRQRAQRRHLLLRAAAPPRSDYLQVHMGKDDGVEMFGGTCQRQAPRRSPAPRTTSVDSDQGYTGAPAARRSSSRPGSPATMRSSCSNQADNLDAEPRTAPKFVNVTAIGTSVSEALDTQSAGVRPQGGRQRRVPQRDLRPLLRPGRRAHRGRDRDRRRQRRIGFLHTLFFNNSTIDDGATPWVVGEGSTYDLAGLIEDAGNNNHFDSRPAARQLRLRRAERRPDRRPPVRGAGQPLRLRRRRLHRRDPQRRRRLDPRLDLLQGQLIRPPVLRVVASLTLCLSFGSCDGVDAGRRRPGQPGRRRVPPHVGDEPLAGGLASLDELGHAVVAGLTAATPRRWSPSAIDERRVHRPPVPGAIATHPGAEAMGRDLLWDMHIRQSARRHAARARPATAERT